MATINFSADSASDLLWRSICTANGISLISLARSRLPTAARWGNVSPPPGMVMAKIVKKGKTKHEYPWPDELELDPNVKGGGPHLPLLLQAPQGEVEAYHAAVREASHGSREEDHGFFEQVTKNAVHGIWARRSKINLVGAHINVFTGEWTQKMKAGVKMSFFHYIM